MQPGSKQHAEQCGAEAADASTTDNWPEYVALRQASADSFRAGAARAAMGGYVPLNHPNHPRRWSHERQEALAAAEAEVHQTAVALRLANQAYRDRLDAIEGHDRPSPDSSSSGPSGGG